MACGRSVKPCESRSIREGGANFWPISIVINAPACLAGNLGFESPIGRQIRNLRIPYFPAKAMTVRLCRRGPN